MDDWRAIRTQAEADAFMTLVGDLHDGCLREAHVWTEQWVGTDLGMRFGYRPDTSVRLLIQRQWAPVSAVELLFEAVTCFHVLPARADQDGIIFGATLRVEGREVQFANVEDWRPDAPGRDEATWIAAGRLRWRDASAWMGSALHYGPRPA